MALLGSGIGRTATAADIGVNDTGDVLHAPGCAVTGAGTCSLRDAITFGERLSGMTLRIF